MAYSVGAAFSRSRLAGSSRLSRVCVRGFFNALGWVCDQRLRRPPCRWPCEAHEPTSIARRVSFGQRSLTVICSSCCQLVLTRVDYEYPNYPALFYRYSVSLCLPVYEALHSPASTGAWPRVQLVDSYGLGCSSKYADSTSLGTVFD
ncbi:Uncharacterised protein [Vibrio cholerae]|nr:Uncharacterised protein [Vibrio cholerae]